MTLRSTMVQLVHERYIDNRQLLEEWSIYVMQIPADLRPCTNVGRDSDAMEGTFQHNYADIGKTDAHLRRVWQGMHCELSLEVGYIYRCHQRMLNGRSVPITNLIVCSSRLSLSHESVRALHSAA